MQMIGEILLKLDSWFESMLAPTGYGGPVSHWWRDDLLYTGAGLDWRYEGIITGYLVLHEKTGDDRWLMKAQRAGDHLVSGLLDSGNYRNSSFELNPYSGGTPHEATNDLALLRLATVLKHRNDSSWERYSNTAARNLTSFILGSLWDGSRQRFRNTVGDLSFVPNKAASIVEALFAWARLTQDEQHLETYVRPTLETILASQINSPGDSVDGAIYQAVSDSAKNRRFFPFYIARCIPALLLGYEHWQEARYLNDAISALNFILRHRYDDGSFPQVIYENGRINRYPQWVAGTGDILRAMDALAGYGLDVDAASTLAWMLRDASHSAALPTAWGFSRLVSQGHPPASAEFRDLLPVCGWVDKAFHFLARQVDGALPATTTVSREIRQPCTFAGQSGTYVETETDIRFQQGQESLYHWQKGSPWATQCI
jgi:hypothetical protein